MYLVFNNKACYFTKNCCSWLSVRPSYKALWSRHRFWNQILAQIGSETPHGHRSFIKVLTKATPRPSIVFNINIKVISSLTSVSHSGFRPKISVYISHLSPIRATYPKHHHFPNTEFLEITHFSLRSCPPHPFKPPNFVLSILFSKAICASSLLLK